MTRRVLLCSEAGVGRGHGARLADLGRRFEARGLDTVYAVRPGGGSAALLHDRGVRLIGAPRWSTEGLERHGSSATLADMLWDDGLGSTASLSAQIAAWNLIFSECVPDLVVSDYAPGANLAARGRLPLLVTGSGFCAPPAHLTACPPLHTEAPPAVDQTELVDRINTVLSRTGARPLGQIGELFAGDIQHPMTFAELDPYAGARSAPAVAPHIPAPKAGQQGDGLFVYFWSGNDRRQTDALCRSLSRLTMRRLVYAPGLSVENHAVLTGSACEIAENPVTPHDITAFARLVVHRGGLGLTGAMLVSGTPQLVIATDIEKLLNGEAVERLGAGACLRGWQAGPDEIAAGIEQAWADERMRERARDLAPGFAQAAAPDSFERIVEDACSHLL